MNNDENFKVDESLPFINTKIGWNSPESNKPFYITNKKEDIWNLGKILHEVIQY